MRCRQRWWLLGVLLLPLGALPARPVPQPGTQPQAPRPVPASDLGALQRSWADLDRELRLLDGALTDPPPSEGALFTPGAPPPPLALPTPPQLSGGSLQALSLEQAVAIGLDQNPELQAQRFEVAAALARLQARLGRYWPELAAVAQFDYGESLNSYAVPQGNQSLGFGPNFAPGGAFSVPTGATATLNQGVRNLSGGLELRYALLDFARTPAVQAARAELRQARSSYANDLRQLQLTITEAYYQLQRSDQLVRIREADLRNDRVVLEDVLALKQAGLVPRLDLLRRKAIQADSEERLIQAEADRKVARRRLATLLNLPPDRLPAASDPIRLQPRWPLDLEASLLAAYRDNPELEAVLAAREALAREKDAVAARLLPRLSVFAGGGGSGSQTNQWNASGDCCGATVIPSLNTKGTDWAVGLTFRWLLFDGGSTAAEVRALARQEAAQAQRFAARRNDIRLRLEQAFFNHEASLVKLASARRGVTASLEAFRDARLRYQSGLSDEVTLSLTQDRLIASLVSRLEASIAVNLTYAQLLRELLPVSRNGEAAPAVRLTLGDDQPPPETKRSIR